jgi:signal transduction histidine kinase
MAIVTKDTVSSSRIITDDGAEDILGGLLAKAVLFFDADGRLRAAHCEIDRVRAWVNGLLDKPLRSLPVPLRELLEKSLGSRRAIRHQAIPIASGSAGGASHETFHASATPAFDAKGALTGVTVALHDLAPVQELSDNLGQLVRLASTGTLAAGLAHEIKNAMVAVKIFVDMLIHKDKDSELAPIVSRELRRIDDIVAQMLRVSGPKHAAFQRVRVHELLDHALAVTQHRMAGSHIRIERLLEADSDVVSGEASQLEQSFVNLLFNAVEAMGSHGTLTVSSTIVHPEDRAPLLRLTIRDTGAGIAPETLRRLFEPFFTTKATGTGLGLVITRSIIRDHGGEIRVQSEPGQGTAFTIDLPSASRQP